MKFHQGYDDSKSIQILLEVVIIIVWNIFDINVPIADMIWYKSRCRSHPISVIKWSWSSDLGHFGSFRDCNKFKYRTKLGDNNF